MHGQCMGDVVMMCLLFCNAVVGRIANFPFPLRLGAWPRRVQKMVCDRQKRCNITWGYVAWIGV